MPKSTKLTFAEGVDRIVVALRKAGHEVSADIANYTVLIDGTSIRIAEGWSAEHWPGVVVKLGSAPSFQVSVTRTGRSTVDTILVALGRERARQASESAKSAASEETKRALAEIHIHGAEVSVGAPWIRYDDTEPAMTFELRIERIRAKQVRPLLEAIGGALGPPTEGQSP